MAANGSISGTVTGAGGGGPVSGARVCAQSTGSSFANFCGTTNATGEYKLEALPEGTYRVRFERTGEYLPLWYPTGEKQGEATIVTVTGGSDAPGIDIEPRVGGVIEGVITDATSGTGLEKIQACAVPATMQGAFESHCAISDADGRYRIVGIDGGEYRLRLLPEYLDGDPDYLTQFYPDVELASEGTIFQVTDGATRAGVDAAMHLGGGISGRVVNDAGDPVQGVSVCAYPVLGPESFSFCVENGTTTGADGTYRIRGVPSGEYKVDFYGDASYLPQFFPDQTTRAAGGAVTVSGTATTGGVDATVHHGGVISGTLTEAGTGDPIPQASVCAYSTGNGLEHCGQAKADGSYSIQTLPTGEYEVEFAGPDNSTDWPFVTGWYGGVTDRADATRIQVTAGVETSGIDGEVARGGTISGLVTDAASGEPASGIYACAYFGGEVVGHCDTTFTDGEYTIVGVPTGNYAVRFSPAAGGVEQDFRIGNKNYLPQFDGDVQGEAEATPVIAGPGIAKTGIDAAMHEGGGISGRITGPLGQPLEGTTACVVTTAQQLGEQCGSTDPAGEYEIQGLYPGAYTVHFWGNGAPTNQFSEQYFDGVLDFDEAEPVMVVGTGVTTGIDAQLVPGGRVEGTVTDGYDGSPLVGAGVCSEGVDGRGGICVESEAGGHYSMNLGAGSYRVRFTYGYDEGESEVAEFARQYFGGATDEAGATAVTVASETTVSNINAALQPTAARLNEVSVATGGAGSGAVTSSPAGIDCGSSCSSEFETRKTVTLAAEPSPGSTFTGWTGACSGTGPCQIRLTAAAEVAATFESSSDTSGTPDQSPSTQSTNAPGPSDTAQPVTSSTTPGSKPVRTSAGPKPKPVCKKGFKAKKFGKHERCAKVPKKHHSRKHHPSRH